MRGRGKSTWVKGRRMRGKMWRWRRGERRVATSSNTTTEAPWHISHLTRSSRWRQFSRPPPFRVRVRHLLLPSLFPPLLPSIPRRLYLGKVHLPCRRCYLQQCPRFLTFPPQVCHRACLAWRTTTGYSLSSLACPTLCLSTTWPRHKATRNTSLHRHLLLMLVLVVVVVVLLLLLLLVRAVYTLLQLLLLFLLPLLLLLRVTARLLQWKQQAAGRDQRQVLMAESMPPLPPTAISLLVLAVTSRVLSPSATVIMMAEVVTTLGMSQCHMRWSELMPRQSCRQGGGSGTAHLPGSTPNRP